MGIISTDHSGLADSTTYYFKVNGVEYDITTGTSPTFADVTNLVDAAIDPAGLKAYLVQDPEGGEDIRVYNEGFRGSGSECSLDHGDTTPDLFINLNFWSRFRDPIVYALEPSEELYNIIREMTGEIRIGGGADWDIPIFENVFYKDTYYKDEYYTGD